MVKLRVSRHAIDAFIARFPRQAMDMTDNRCHERPWSVAKVMLSLIAKATVIERTVLHTYYMFESMNFVVLDNMVVTVLVGKAKKIGHKKVKKYQKSIRNKNQRRCDNRIDRKHYNRGASNKEIDTEMEMFHVQEDYDSSSP